MSPMNWAYLSTVTFSLMKMSMLLIPHHSAKKNKNQKKILHSKKWAW